MARAMVLAAGFGTRLRPLSSELPKALVPVGDHPLAWHIVERLRRAGFDEVAMNAHYLSDIFSMEVASFPSKVHLIREPRIRGTAGGVAGARSVLGPAPVIVWNTDILADPPIAEMLAVVETGGLCLAVAPRPISEGTLGTGSDGRVVRLRGKTFAPETCGGDYIGVAALGADVLGSLPDDGCLIGDVALPRLARGEPVFSVPAMGAWRDVGTVGEYLAANLEWLSQSGGDRGWVHPTATVSGGVRVVRSVVGARAVVNGSGVLENSVVWPSARAVAPLCGTVVTSSGAVVRP